MEAYLQSPDTLQQKLVSKITSAIQVHIASLKSSLQICWRDGKSTVLLTLNGTSGGTTELKMLVRHLLSDAKNGFYCITFKNSPFFKECMKHAYSYVHAIG